jgi:hypothetical protein
VTALSGTTKKAYAIGGITNNWIRIPDEVVERVLTLLRDEEIYESPLAGHILNFFEFKSSSQIARNGSVSAF